MKRDDPENEGGELAALRLTCRLEQPFILSVAA